jgi:O-acetyl-ADP-ribose deacetylase (regulator of RNase III)
MILQASYEMTLYAALRNSLRHPKSPGAKKVFLTLLGAGVFGNPKEWCYEAMESAMHKFRKTDLEVSVIFYHTSMEGMKFISSLVDGKNDVWKAQ